MLIDEKWYTPGSVVRVNEYEFDDDGTKRDKYLIVLYTDEEKALIIDCLTTSKGKGVATTHFGCTIHNNKFPYYFFPAGQVIGKNNYFFDLDTYIFFKDNVRLEAISKFQKQMALSIFGIAKLDELAVEELKRLIKCALKSKFVPIDVANILNTYKSTL